MVYNQICGPCCNSSKKILGGRKKRKERKVLETSSIVFNEACTSMHIVMIMQISFLIVFYLSVRQFPLQFHTVSASTIYHLFCYLGCSQNNLGTAFFSADTEFDYFMINLPAFSNGKLTVENVIFVSFVFIVMLRHWNGYLSQQFLHSWPSFPRILILLNMGVFHAEGFQGSDDP